MSINLKMSPLKVIDNHGREQIYYKAINITYFSEKMTKMNMFVGELMTDVTVVSVY